MGDAGLRVLFAVALPQMGGGVVTSVSREGLSGVVLRVGETGGPSGICQRAALQGGLSIHLSLSAKCHCDDVSIQSCSWQRAPL